VTFYFPLFDLEGIINYELIFGQLHNAASLSHIGSFTKLRSDQ
jgi:hypothetical protein